MRHFNWQRYNRPGIKDILFMNDYVDLVVGKIDRYNAGEYEDSWDKEEIIRDLLQFCDYLLVAIGDATWKDVEAFQIMTKRVKDLEISLGIRKKSPPPKKPTKPSVEVLMNKGRKFPPNYLHESWMDFLYWDAELES